MKYDLTKTEYKRLADFLKKKIDGAISDSGYFDTDLPTWFDRVEKIHAKMIAKPNKLQLSLSAWEVKHLGNVRGLDEEFAELSSFLDAERERLIDTGKLPIWLRKP
ncbi:hypothetical protein [uncultured Spirosoma sp.]|uniref:hypothetical protein n=1 Tax=uncultured Spirosoma sp. TaxID=278208 RepID=UPI00258D31E8|nr:hypothetical protein [uncultured Spirosoma sp.]